MIRPQIVGWREVLQAVRPVLQEVRPVLKEGFPTAGNWRKRKACRRLTRSVSVRPQAVPEGLRRYPKGFPNLGNFGALPVKAHVVDI